MARYSNPATRKGTPFRVLRVQGAGRWERPESQKVIWIPSPNSQNYQDQIMALSSFRMKIHIFKIDVDDGVDPQDRCRRGFGCPKSMSVRVWMPKTNVREGLGPQDRCRGWFEFPKSMAKRAHNFSKAQSQCTRWHLVHWFWLYPEHRILITINLFKRCLIRSWNQYIILIRLILKSIGIHTKSHLKINPYLTRKNQNNNSYLEDKKSNKSMQLWGFKWPFSRCTTTPTLVPVQLTHKLLAPCMSSWTLPAILLYIYIYTSMEPTLNPFSRKR